MGSRSCAGCEYLYFHDIKYSNCTVIDTVAHCALDLNPYLKGKEIEVPYDWRHNLDNGIYDRWEATCNSMCERFSPRKRGCSPAAFDVDGDIKAAKATVGLSRAARRAIAKHSGR